MNLDSMPAVVSDLDTESVKQDVVKHGDETVNGAKCPFVHGNHAESVPNGDVQLHMNGEKNGHIG